MELYANSWSYIQAYGTACKLMKLYSRLWNCMQAHGTPWATLGNLGKPCEFLLVELRLHS